MVRPLCLLLLVSTTAALVQHQAARFRSQGNAVAADRQYIRPCYFTNWAQYRQGRAKYAPNAYVPGLCTHILYAFGWMNEDFTVKAYDPSDLPNDWGGKGQYALVNELKDTDKNLRTALSFGGWTFGTRLFNGMTSTPENRQVFINSALRFVRKYNFDGIDIDWEYPTGHQAAFTALIKELRAAAEAEARLTGKPRLSITAAVAAGAANIDGAYDVKGFAESIDFINLMSYDFWGAWDGETGMNSPLYSRSGLTVPKSEWNVDWAANHWAQLGMPKEKIVIGVGSYGRGWTLQNPSNVDPGSTGNSPAQTTQYVREAGIGAYFELCEFLAQGAQRYWHSEHQVPYMVKGNQWWSYDDVQSVTNKMNYIKKNGFGGAMVWTLDLDDFNAGCSNGGGQIFPIIGTIAKELAGIVIKGHNGTTPTLPPSPPTNVPTVTQIPGKTTTPSGGAFSCNGRPDGFYADPADCTGFYRCVGGTPYHFNCPAGTFWNEANTDCDYNKPATCTN